MDYRQQNRVLNDTLLSAIKHESHVHSMLVNMVYRHMCMKCTFHAHVSIPHVDYILLQASY